MKTGKKVRKWEFLESAAEKLYFVTHDYFDLL